MERDKNLDDEPSINEIDKERQGETIVSDVYDLYKEVIQVRSPLKDITSDFVLSDLTEENIDNKAVKFVREQIKACMVIDIFLIDKTMSQKIKELLMADVHSTVIMTRAVGGKVLKSILTFGKPEEEEEPKRVIDRLTGRKK